MPNNMTINPAAALNRRGSAERKTDGGPRQAEHFSRGIFGGSVGARRAVEGEDDLFREAQPRHQSSHEPMLFPEFPESEDRGLAEKAKIPYFRREPFIHITFHEPVECGRRQSFWSVLRQPWSGVVRRRLRTPAGRASPFREAVQADPAGLRP